MVSKISPDIIKIVVLTAFAFSINCCENSPTKPNVILVFTDDQGYGDFSVFGNPHVQTPNLDKLSEECIVFSNFHVAPVCTPTRSQLITGIDAMHNAAYSPHGQFHLLNKDLPTMAEVFKHNGYQTALYGKWHLGGNFENYRPHERGFDDAVYFLRGGHWSHPNYWNSDCYDDFYYHNGKLEQFKGYATDIWFDLGMKFIKNCKKENSPFLLFLPLNAPHLPWLSPSKYRKPYLESNLDKSAINFFAMISAVDEQMGTFIDFLKNSHAWDNTIFLFFTDNGSTLWEQEYNAGMKGKKGSLYEGGHRVPLFFSWPQKGFSGPSEISELTECQDIFPTLMTLCKLKFPDSIPFEGLDITELIEDRNTNEIKNRVEIVQYQDTKYQACIMFKEWRLVNGDELYNLETDPLQEHNIINENRHIADSLLRIYDSWWMNGKSTSIPQPYYISGKEEVKLTAYDWYEGERIYNWPHLRNGDKSNGKYLLFVTNPGKYYVTLRRWPVESGAGICESVPAFRPFDDYLGSLPASENLPVVKGKVQLGNQIIEKEVKPDDKEISFSVILPEGENHLQTWFIENDGTQSGAYYVYINRVTR
jgi:arylsulfatase A-like enzyme